MKIGRYEILDEIGQGAMGTVYRARDPLIERTVAIKAVPIVQLQQEGAGAELRFLHEAQSAGRLSHPHIVTIYDVGEANGLAYIAMEHLPGPTLRDVMDSGPMPLQLVLGIAIQMAEALAFAHEHNVIHRDIKPANVVIIDEHGHIKLTDFGIALLGNGDQTFAGQMLGSPRYMSPEQSRGHEVDGRSDIFSLGAVLYEMITGQYAFDGDSLPTIVYRVVNETPVPVEELRPQLSAELASLLTRMLHKNPDARPDAAAVASTLHALAKSEQGASKVVSRVPLALRLVAFGTPAGVFLLLALGIAVIQHLVPPTPHTVFTPPSVSVPPRPAAASPPKPAAPTAARQPSPREPDLYLAGLDRKQAELRLKRTELLLKYTKRHPDVVQIDRQLEQLRAERRRHLQELKRQGRQAP